MEKKEKKWDMKKIQKAIEDKFAEMDDKENMQIRSKFMDRWAELSGATKDENGKWDYSQIDWDNKWVKLEWWMCDKKIFFKLTNEKTRAEGILLLPEDCRETYFQVGPGNDKPYSEVNFGMSSVKSHIRKLRGKH